MRQQSGDGDDVSIVTQAWKTEAERVMQPHIEPDVSGDVCNTLKTDV
jgi:hypothetical protein